MEKTRISQYVIVLVQYESNLILNETFYGFYFEVIILYPIFAQILKYYANNFHSSGLPFMFYSNEHLPIHIHVIKAGCKAKFSILPVVLVENCGFKPSELKMIESIIEDNEEVIAEHWNKYFNN